MPKSLDTIYMNGNKDKRYAFDEAWYKESKYGSCPEDNFGLVASYLLRFGCDVKDAKNVRIHKSNEAKQCASQRMSDMKYRANNRRKIDGNHVYPILLAKGLGHECLSLSNDTKHLKIKLGNLIIQYTIIRLSAML